MLLLKRNKQINSLHDFLGKRSGSVDERSTCDQWVAGFSHTSGTVICACPSHVILLLSTDVPALVSVEGKVKHQLKQYTLNDYILLYRNTQYNLHMDSRICTV